MKAARPPSSSSSSSPEARLILAASPGTSNRSPLCQALPSRSGSLTVSEPRDGLHRTSMLPGFPAETPAGVGAAAVTGNRSCLCGGTPGEPLRSSAVNSDSCRRTREGWFRFGRAGHLEVRCGRSDRGSQRKRAPDRPCL